VHDEELQMLLSRDELIAVLFRETDRSQRMMTGLSVILYAIHDWEARRLRLGERSLFESEEEVAAQVLSLLRCYDSVGRYGDGEFAVVLPGCNSFNAVSMAERLGHAISGSMVRAGAEEVQFTACFGVAGSGGRSPVVVLKNAQRALERARAKGAGSIERSSYDAEPDPATLLMPVIGDGALHW
jgi:two-component system cell cycle response regulator